MTLSEPAASVIVPTYHRPRALRRAVRSVLAQRLPTGQRLAVLIALSDPADTEGSEVARQLAASDDRVQVVHASRPGPAAARNAGIKFATAPDLAFLDDDCEAAPGWLEAGLEALQTADLIQGRTLPAGPWRAIDHSIRVESLTWLWESCNIFVRRELVDRAGCFDESWSVYAGGTKTWGEDIEWGWRLLRAGARPAFVAGALAIHEMQPRTRAQYLAHKARLRYFPWLIRSIPEVRRHFWKGYFVSPRHANIAASMVLVGIGVISMAAGSRRIGGTLAAMGALAYLSPLMVEGAGPRDLADRGLEDAVEMGAALYGSIRWRRLLV